MPEISKLSLNAGEVSDELAGRIDLNKYNTGCEILENARVLRVGGVTRRAGFEYVDTITESTRLVGFRFSETQGYVLEFSNLKMRVIQNGVIDATVYATPWTTAQIFDLQFAQRIDRIIVTHPDVEVNNIIKLNDGTWEVSVFPWEERIWEVYPNSENIALSVDALGTVGGSVTLTSSEDLFTVLPSFQGLDVGDRVQLSHTVSESTEEYYFYDQNPTRLAFNRATSYNVDDIVYYDNAGNRELYRCKTLYLSPPGVPPDNGPSPEDYPAYFEQTVLVVPVTMVSAGWVFETFGTWTGVLWIQRSYDNSTWSTIKTISSEDNRNERVVETETEDVFIRVVVAETVDNVRVEFTTNSYTDSGSGIIASISTKTTATLTVEEPFISTEPTALWYECAFSDRNGYPVGVTFYQGRLCFGGTITRPQTLWLSRIQSPFDFTIGTLATDGMSFQTDAEGYEAITWLSSHLTLLVGTTLGVWALSSPDGSTLTPESNRISRQMQLGAQKGFQAAPLQNNVLFLQYKGRKIQELTGGSVEYGGYLASDLTQLATHITRGGVTQIATGELPDSTLYLVSGGELALLTYERSQNVVGWARWVTDGDVESVAVTSGAGEDDDIYIVVNRGGSRYIEYFRPDMLRIEEDNDVFNLRFLDCFTEKIDVTPFSTMAGLDRFDGMEVDSFVDGEPNGPITVTGGVADFGRDVTNAVVGLPYTTEVRPMPIDFGAIGSKSTINDITIRFRNSLGGEVSQDRENWSTVQQLQPRITDDTPLGLLSQDYQSTPFSTWQRKPSISVRQTQPLPMTILAMRLKTKSSK